MPHKEIVEDITGDCKPGYCLLKEILIRAEEEIPENDSQDDCHRDKYCTLKEKIIKSGLSDRTLEQIKCVEILKWHESQDAGRELDWEEAWELWIKQGHAEAFSNIYQDGMTHKELYTKIIYRKHVLS